MKLAALLLTALSLLAQPVRDGNFDIRFEPTAKLQTNVEVPFEINVLDGRKQPLQDAKVTMRIAMLDSTHEATLPARATTPGVYVAKPNFPVAGQWNVEVTVRRNDQQTDRTIQFNVVE